MTSGAAPDTSRRDRFERVSRLVLEPLQRYVLRRSPAELRDDVVADTLLVLWRRLDEVAEGDELPWCYGVARRVLANHRRSVSRSLRLVGRLASMTRPDDHVVAPFDVVLGSGGAVRAALHSLNTDDRDVLTMWAWEGLEAREIAIVLGVSTNAASIRLHRARRRLAARLTDGKNSLRGGHILVERPEAR